MSARILLYQEKSRIRSMSNSPTLAVTSSSRVVFGWLSQSVCFGCNRPNSRVYLNKQKSIKSYYQRASNLYQNQKCLVAVWQAVPPKCYTSSMQWRSGTPRPGTLSSISSHQLRDFSSAWRLLAGSFDNQSIFSPMLSANTFRPAPTIWLKFEMEIFFEPDSHGKRAQGVALISLNSTHMGYCYLLQFGDYFTGSFSFQ